MITIKTLEDAREFVYSTSTYKLYHWRDAMRSLTWWGDSRPGLDHPKCASPDVQMYMIDHCVRLGWHPYSRLRKRDEGPYLSQTILLTSAKWSSAFTPVGTFVLQPDYQRLEDFSFDVRGKGAAE